MVRHERLWSKNSGMHGRIEPDACLPAVLRDEALPVYLVPDASAPAGKAPM
jgi:hypothetical protein